MSARPKFCPVADYIDAGLALVPIAQGSKGPRTTGWNLKSNAITNAAKFPGGMGVGIAHAWSGTCAIDVDDLTAARAYLAARKIDLDAMLTDPVNVQIVSGRPNRAKLLFRMFNKEMSLPSKKIMYNGVLAFELRSGTAEGLTVQDCAPPTVHPDTGKPYEWLGDWHNIPTIPNGLFALWCEIIEGDKQHVMSTGNGSIHASWDEIEEALYKVPANCDRKTHTDIGMALKMAGEQLGQIPKAAQLFLDWSATGAEKFKGMGDVLGQFNSYRNNHGNPINIATLFHHARQHGWKRRLPDVGHMFESMTIANTLERAGFPTDTAAELVSPATMSDELGLTGYIGLRLPYIDAAGQPVMDGGKPYSRVMVIGSKWKTPYRKRIGAGVHAYLPKQVDWTRIATGNEPVFIVEGEKTANLMASNGVAVVALEWIGGFRDSGRIIPEINAFKWEGRKVFILPNVINDTSIRAGAGLAAWLKSRRADAVLVDFHKYDDPSDFSNHKLVSIATNNIGYVDLAVEMGEGWENFALSLGEIAYVKKNSLWVHLTDYCGKQNSPVRTHAMMTSDLENRMVRSGDKYKPVFKMIKASRHRLEVDGTVFYPHEVPMTVTEDGRNFNLWGGFRLAPKHNEEIAGKIRAAVRSFFSTWYPFGINQDDEQRMAERYYWGFMAHIAQCSEKHATVSITFQSRQQGIGKSILLESVKSFMGDTCKIITPKQLFSDFSNWIEGAYFVIVNEPSTDDGKHRQDMKTLRTNPTIEINIKGGQKYEVPNIMTFALTTNELYTHGMDEQERRDFVYSPSWLSVSNANQLADPAAKAAHLHHNKLIVEMATHLAPDSTEPDRDEWAAAFYAMLLDIDVEAMGFKPNGPAPATSAKTRMAMASKSGFENEREILLRDIGERIDRHGGVLFSVRSFDAYLHSLSVNMNPLEAKKLIAGQIAIARGLHLVENKNSKLGPEINEVFRKNNGGFTVENEQVKVWGVVGYNYKAASVEQKKKWVLATNWGDTGEDE